ncbi:MAG: 4-hydroxyproline epimerase [Ottowia sp.]
MKSLRVIDSHTGGEPTRLVVAGGPDLGSAPLAERRRLFGARYDYLRTGIVCEPRGSDVLVGALLCEPTDARCSAGVIFFNNAGYLGMCGHGTIGLMVSLAHMGRIRPGWHGIETPVGVVRACLHADGSVTVRNVPAYRYRQAVSVNVPGHGAVTGDVAWGGNWFFLVSDHGQRLEFERAEALAQFAWQVRQALAEAGVTGAGGAEVDHVELFADLPPGAAADSRNFVLCPGRAYDRSPCGTGTSAKLACLAAEGRLAPGQAWRQEGIVGSVFEGSYETHAGLPPGHIVPSIRGRAHISAEATLLFDADDPFAWGVVPA